MEEEKKNQEDVSENEVEFIEGELTSEAPETEEEKKDKKIKNLISIIILLSGLFVGSLFVDIVQLVKGGGFSQKALNSTDVFSSGGKTWVAYTEPLVKVQVISDDTCGEACKPDEVLVGLKEALPTMTTEKIDVKSEQGQKLVAQFGLKTIPAFIFSKEIESTDLFAKAQPFLDKQGDSYAIKSAEAGFPVGKYIVAPAVSDKDIKIGSDEAKVKVFEFTDFQCPFCKNFHQSVIAQLLKEYGDKIQFVFKNYPLQSHAQANVAALAGACANEQGKFVEYSDKLFATQDVWGKQKDATATLKGYAATLKLNVVDFNKCLDDKKYQDLIDQTKTEAQSFGIQGTPTMFIGNEIQNSSAKYDDIKKVIDDQLAK
jgi:protein-disulfide isomerase